MLLELSYLNKDDNYETNVKIINIQIGRNTTIVYGITLPVITTNTLTNTIRAQYNNNKTKLSSIIAC